MHKHHGVTPDQRPPEDEEDFLWLGLRDAGLTLARLHAQAMKEDLIHTATYIAIAMKELRTAREQIEHHR